MAAEMKLIPVTIGVLIDLKYVSRRLRKFQEENGFGPTDEHVVKVIEKVGTKSVIEDEEGTKYEYEEGTKYMYEVRVAGKKCCCVGAGLEKTKMAAYLAGLELASQCRAENVVVESVLEDVTDVQRAFAVTPFPTKTTANIRVAF